MQRYREFLPQAPEELGAFLGLKAILSSAPFPNGALGKAHVPADVLLRPAGGGGQKGLGAAARCTSRALVQLDGRDAVSRWACDALDQGLLGVLKKKYDPANLFRVNQNILPSP
jgi:hypothetical protein